jgi:S1-C subfamily serine protease
MKKALLKFIFYVVSVAAVAFLINLFVGDSLAAHIANWEWVKKYNIVRPGAPLVIHTREEVRVNDTNDIIAALNRTRGKVAAVTAASDGHLLGSAVAVTSDGVFLTAKTAVAELKPEQLVLVLADGKRVAVTHIVLDPATELVALRTTGNGLSVVSFIPTSELSAGQRILLLGANNDGSSYFLSSFLSTAERSASGVVSSDAPSRTLLLQSVSGTIPGQAVFDLSGQLVGVWNGQQLTPASIAQEIVTSMAAHEGQIVRPFLGFFYRVVTAAEAANQNTTAGLLVTRPPGSAQAIFPNSSAINAGLREGDIITKINNQQVVGALLPDALLTSLTANTKAIFEVRRGSSTVQLELTPSAW